MPDFPIRRTIRLIGAPTDINSSFLRGPALGPAAIRKAVASEHVNGTAEIGDAYSLDVLFNDAGDLPLTEETARMAELNLSRDIHDMTATVAAKLMRKIAALVARNEQPK
jgi:arginase family enzyme